MRDLISSTPPDLFLLANGSAPKVPSMSLLLLTHLLLGLQGICQVFDIPNATAGTVATGGLIEAYEDILIVISNIDQGSWVDLISFFKKPLRGSGENSMYTSTNWAGV